MTYSLVGSPWTQAGSNALTVSVSPTAIGDLMVLTFDDNDSTVTSSACSGGGVTTWNLAQSVPGVGPNPPRGTVEIWWGVVTSTGSSTITLTNSGVDSLDFTRFWVAQWHSSVAGTWGVTLSGSLAGSGTSFNYPLLSGSGLYIGAAVNDFGTFSSGGTTGFTYTVIDGHLMTTYNVAASGSQPAGATNDAGSGDQAIAALFNVTVPPPGVGPPIDPGPLPNFPVRRVVNIGVKGAAHSW